MMNNIEYLKKQNIQFNSIDENAAQQIMENEYPCYKLYEYSHLFKYSHFLDFSLLYYLAVLDEKLRHIVICNCLDLEQSLKTIIIDDAERLAVKDSVLEDYFKLDGEYLLSYYNSDNIDYFNNEEISNSISSLSFEQFLEVIQFGTFEKFLHYFYKKYAISLYNKEYAPYECHINSVKRLRNISAHNGLLIGSLDKKREISSDKVASFLGSHGIKHKTLRSNMSKQTVFDICNLLHLCFLVLPKTKFEKTLAQLNDFLQKDCKQYKHVYSNNSLLVSVYNFTNSVVDIYANC